MRLFKALFKARTLVLSLTIFDNQYEYCEQFSIYMPAINCSIFALYTKRRSIISSRIRLRSFIYILHSNSIDRWMQTMCFFLFIKVSDLTLHPSPVLSFSFRREVAIDFKITVTVVNAKIILFSYFATFLF